MANETGKMMVEIWSDVTCPFCYISKRKFEAALKQFNAISNIEVVWKSFELAPNLQAVEGKSIYQHLAEHGMPIEQAKSASLQLAETAKHSGLVFDFDKTIPANSFKAHCLSHLAKRYGLQDKAEEILLKAYFTDGENLNDIQTLVQLGEKIGLDAVEVKFALENEVYKNEVQQDILEASQSKIKSVPSYVFNNKHVLTGVQESAVYLEHLEKSFNEWKKDNRSITTEIEEGPTCMPGGLC